MYWDTVLYRIFTQGTKQTSGISTSLHQAIIHCYHSRRWRLKEKLDSIWRYQVLKKDCGMVNDHPDSWVVRPPSLPQPTLLAHLALGAMGRDKKEHWVILLYEADEIKEERQPTNIYIDYFIRPPIEGSHRKTEPIPNCLVFCCCCFLWNVAN